MKNHYICMLRMPKHCKQRLQNVCSKTWSKREKHEKIALRLKQCSKNTTIFEKSRTWAQEKCSKSSIFMKTHEIRVSKMAKHLKQRFKNVRKSGSCPPKSAKIVRKLKNRCKMITKIANRLKHRSKTCSKREKHEKIGNRRKQRSKNVTIFEKSRTWVQEKCSKS